MKEFNEILKVLRHAVWEISKELDRMEKQGARKGQVRFKTLVYMTPDSYELFLMRVTEGGVVEFEYEDMTRSIRPDVPFSISKNGEIIRPQGPSFGFYSPIGIYVGEL